MKKLIASGTKKNIEKARRRLESANVEAVTYGTDSDNTGSIKGTEAIELGYRYLGEFKALQALDIAERLLEKVDDIIDVYLLKARALLDLEALGELSPLVEHLTIEAPQNLVF